jgi:hypothetical protein
MSNKKRKAKILRATVAYLSLKTDRHEKVLKIHMDELKDIEAGLKRMLEMYKLLNANRGN